MISTDVTCGRNSPTLTTFVFSTIEMNGECYAVMTNMTLHITFTALSWLVSIVQTYILTKIRCVIWQGKLEITL